MVIIDDKGNITIPYGDTFDYTFGFTSNGEPLSFDGFTTEFIIYDGTNEAKKLTNPGDIALTEGQAKILVNLDLPAKEYKYDWIFIHTDNDLSGNPIIITDHWVQDKMFRIT